MTVVGQQTKDYLKKIADNVLTAVSFRRSDSKYKIQNQQDSKNNKRNSPSTDAPNIGSGLRKDEQDLELPKNFTEFQNAKIQLSGRSTNSGDIKNLPLKSALKTSSAFVKLDNKASTDNAELSPIPEY